MNQSELEANTCKRRQVPGKRERQKRYWCFLITSNWLRKWHESYAPVKELSKAKPNRITLDTQLKTALSYQ